MKTIIFRAARFWLAAALTFVALHVQAAGFDHRYRARIGDLNGDSQTDIYLQHAPNFAFVPLDDISVPIALSKTALKSFVLLRETNGSFSLVTNLTSAQQAAAHTWSQMPGRFWAQDFNGDGASDLYIGNTPSHPNPAALNEAVILAPSGSMPATVVDGIAAETYYVRVGDINNDNKLDLFVTGNSRRFVQSFLLQQVTTPSFTVSFTVVSQPSASQLQVASTWPVADTPVFREDLNFDGYNDFYIEDVINAIPSGPDIIVYTQRGVGTTAGKAVAVDQEFRHVATDIADALTQGKAALDYFYNLTCLGVINPNLIFQPYTLDWLFNPSPDSWYRERYIDLFFAFTQSNGYTTNTDTCFPNGVYEEPATQRFYRAYGDYLGIGGALCGPDCFQRAHQHILNDPAWQAVFGSVAQASAAVASRAWILTGMLIADDAVIVGTIDDVLVPITLTVAGTAAVVYVVADALHNEDAGPIAPPALPGSAVATGDPFNPPPGCTPNDLGPQIRPGNANASSRRLGNNMRKVGCDKPHPDAQAHHIVQGGNDDAAAVEARALLRDYGIDIDEAANGVWLPKNSRVPGTSAQPHVGNGMHSPWYRARVLARLQNAASSGGAQGIRAELNTIRELLLRSRLDLL